MKKFLLTAVLVLALVTALTAGTMARYSQTVATITSDVTAKTFKITADQKTGSFVSGLKIAPGDTLKYRVTVNNESEVKSDLTVKTSIEGAFVGLKYSIVNEKGDASADTESTDDGHAVKTWKVTEGGSQTYLITVDWPFSTEAAEKSQGAKMQLKIDVSGEQSDTDHQDVNMNEKAA